MIQSLYKACKRTGLNGISATQEIGGHNIFIELYGQKDIDNKVALGNSSQENIVLIYGDEINIPSGRTITPSNPKKSLVIFCNKFTNNGTISMTAKGSNAKPHDYFILSKNDGTGLTQNIVIPAYANNKVGGINKTFTALNVFSGINGNNGTNRQCGSGGTGAHVSVYNSSSTTLLLESSGGGSAFAGGGGSGTVYGNTTGNSVDSIYPMNATNGKSLGSVSGVEYIYAMGGVGNTQGATGYNNTTSTKYKQNFGVGGRVIIFCNEFENNGTITANGVNAVATTISGNFATPQGGAGSGAGAIDIFYTTLTARGTTTANGGSGALCRFNGSNAQSGAGGNGSITLTEWSVETLVRPQQKYMSKDNMIFFLQEFVNRYNGE